MARTIEQDIRADGAVNTIAAIQDAWTQPDGEKLRSCAMVITEPNKYVAEVHDRMPVILEKKDFEQWERGDVKDAATLMKPADESVLQKWPVSKRVSKVIRHARRDHARGKSAAIILISRRMRTSALGQKAKLRVFSTMSASPQ